MKRKVIFKYTEVAEVSYKDASDYKHYVFVGKNSATAETFNDLDIGIVSKDEYSSKGKYQIKSLNEFTGGNGWTVYNGQGGFSELKDVLFYIHDHLEFTIYEFDSFIEVAEFILTFKR